MKRNDEATMKNGREIWTIGAVLKITGDKLTIDSVKRASAIAAYANKNCVSINKAIQKVK